MSKFKRFTGQQEFATYERGGSYDVIEESNTADALSTQYRDFENRQTKWIKKYFSNLKK